MNSVLFDLSLKGRVRGGAAGCMRQTDPALMPSCLHQEGALKEVLDEKRDERKKSDSSRKGIQTSRETRGTTKDTGGNEQLHT